MVAFLGHIDATENVHVVEVTKAFLKCSFLKVDQILRGMIDGDYVCEISS